MKLQNHFQEYWPIYVRYFGIIALAISPLLICAQTEKDGWWKNYWFLLLFAGVIANIAADAFSSKHNKTRKNMRDEIHKLNEDLKHYQKSIEDYDKDYFDKFNDDIRILSEALGFGDKERISVYKHETGKFQLLGRYSKDPVFGKEHRKYFPDNQGVIEGAWRNETCMLENLPDYEIDPKKYLEELKKNGIPNSVAKQLTMKSRSYFAKVIYDKRPKRAAVIVCESISPNIFTELNIINALNDERVGYIASFILNHRSTEPTRQYAKEIGF